VPGELIIRVGKLQGDWGRFDEEVGFVIIRCLTRSCYKGIAAVVVAKLYKGV
jgi:hypothetical protein